MRRNRLRPFLVVALLGTGCMSGPGEVQDPEAELLALHQDAIEAHLANDLDRLLRPEAEDYVLVSRGDVSHPSMEDRAAFLGPYLRTTRFETYVDAVEPVVRVSPDGQMGWVVAQVRVHGVQRQPEGTDTPLEFVSAWIELYEKRDGRWLRTGNVSTFGG